MNDSFVPGAWGRLVLNGQISWLWAGNATYDPEIRRTFIRTWGGVGRALSGISEPPCYLVLAYDPQGRIVLLDSAGHVWDLNLHDLFGLSTTDPRTERTIFRVDFSRLIFCEVGDVG